MLNAPPISLRLVLDGEWERMEHVMKRFISLINFTDQGRRAIKESPDRADAFLADAESLGAKVNALYWTIGGHDGILSFDAVDGETAAALMVHLTSAGNVTVQTLQAFKRDEITSILEKAL